MLELALSGKVEDDKGLIHDQSTNKVFSLDLASIAVKVGVPVDILAAAVQAEIDKADATDTVPGDHAFEAGFTKSYKIKTDIWFIHLRDNIKIEAALVAAVK